MIDAAPMRADAAVPRWAACLALVLALHAAAASLLLRRSVIAEPPPAPDAVLLDLAPEPAAPAQAAGAVPEPTPEPQVEPLATPPIPEPEPPTPEEPDPPQAELIPEPPPPVPEPVRQPAEVVVDPLPLPPPPPPRPPAKRVVAQRPATQPPPRPVQGNPVAEQVLPRAEANPAPNPAPSPAAAASPNATATWMGELASRLRGAKRYPEAARSRGEQGSATVRFTFDRNGRVLAVSLARSSGSQALDEEAVALIRRIEPLPLPPPDLSNDTLTVPVGFTLR